MFAERHQGRKTEDGVTGAQAVIGGNTILDLGQVKVALAESDGTDLIGGPRPRLPFGRRPIGESCRTLCRHVVERSLNSGQSAPPMVRHVTPLGVVTPLNFLDTLFALLGICQLALFSFRRELLKEERILRIGGSQRFVAADIELLEFRRKD